jgi:hypothetical protein
MTGEERCRGVMKTVVNAITDSLDNHLDIRIGIAMLQGNFIVMFVQDPEANYFQLKFTIWVDSSEPLRMMISEQHNPRLLFDRSYSDNRLGEMVNDLEGMVISMKIEDVIDPFLENDFDSYVFSIEMDGTVHQFPYNVHLSDACDEPE